MKVLITNDDGLDFKGLRILAQVFSEIADVYVVAPEGERSSHSHHLTIKGKIRYEEREVPYAKKAYALWGTPADCVHMGLHALLNEEIDLVLSGINRGANISTDIIYSGTISAAREAYIYHVPALALSLNRGDRENYELAARYGRAIAKEYLEQDKCRDYFLNVNVPDLDEKDIKGIMVCDKVGQMDYGDSYTLGKEDDKDYIFIGQSNVRFLGDTNDLRIDASALQNGYISLSAMGNDQFSYDHFDLLDEIAGKIDKSL